MRVSREENILGGIKNNNNISNGNNIKVEQHTFECVDSFKCLGRLINNKNNMHQEIQQRINNANRAYFSIVSLFKSKLFSRESKVRLYITYIRPILTYGCEAWATTKGNDKKLITFDRKVLRRIYGPYYNTSTQQYEIRHNEDLRNLFKHPNVVAFVKSKRIQWLGHVWRAGGIELKEYYTKD